MDSSDTTKGGTPPAGAAGNDTRGDASSSRPGAGRKLSGGLSASDLRARLGLKTGSKPATSSGPAPRISRPSQPAPPAVDPTETSQIERSVLESLRKDIGLPRKGDASANNPAVSAAAARPAAPTAENSTQALSLDDFEDLLVEEVSASLATVDDEDEEPATQALNAADAEAIAASVDAGAKTVPSPAIAPRGERSMMPDKAISGSASLDTAPPPPAPARPPEVEEEESLEGEATQMLDTGALKLEEEEEFDAFPEGEATQIMMAAMDYDPLTGKLAIEDGDAPQSEYVLARDKTSVGRGNNNGIVIPDIALSRRHMVFERYAEGFVARDLDSGNGTFVNGRRIVYAELRNGDRVEIGNLTMRFEQSGGEPEKLWKTEPKVEYHEKDTGAPASPSAGSPPTAPAAPGNARSGGGGPAQPQVLLQQQPHNNALLQQQMMMSNPNMAGYNPNMGPYGGMQQPHMGYPGGYTQQGMPGGMPQRRGSPVVTALIVFFSILLLGLLGLIGWSVYEQYAGGDGDNAEQAQAESEAEKKKRADEFVKQGTTFFDQGRWDDALGAMNQALALDPENADATLYAQIIPEEKENDRRIRAAIKDVKDSPSTGTFDTALLVLKSISPDSTFAHVVRTQHLPTVQKLYKKYLLTEADKAIQSGNFIKARRLVQKVETDLEMKDDADVKKALARIEQKEKEKEKK